MPRGPLADTHVARAVTPDEAAAGTDAHIVVNLRCRLRSTLPCGSIRLRRGNDRGERWRTSVEIALFIGGPVKVVGLVFVVRSMLAGKSEVNV